MSNSGVWTAPRPGALGSASEGTLAAQSCGTANGERGWYAVGAVIGALLLFSPAAPANAVGLGPGLSKGSLTIPDAQLSDWTQAGVVGGIPNTSGWTVVTYDCNGTNDQPGLQSAINSATAPNGKIIQLLANDTCDLGSNELQITRGNVVLRGAARWKNAGQGGTRMLVGRSLGGIKIVGDPQGEASVSPAPVAGATQITVTSAGHGIVAGDWFEIDESFNNGGSIAPACESSNPTPYANYGACNGFGTGNKGKMDLRRATAVSGNGLTITFSPPLRHTYGIDGGFSPRVFEWSSSRQYVGIENLYFESNRPGCNSEDQYAFFITTDYALNWWATGNYFYRSPKAVISTSPATAHFEFSDNIVDGHQRQSGGCAQGDNEVNFYLFYGIDGKITNNVILDTHTFIKSEDSPIGNVIAYNYVAPGNMCETGAYGRIIHIRSQSSFNLFEGNDFGKCRITTDAFWGASLNGQTYFRNRLRSVPDNNLNGSIVELERFRGDKILPVWGTVSYVGNHFRGATKTLWGCGPVGNSYSEGKNGDVNCQVRNSWFERNVFWDPVLMTPPNYRGFVAGIYDRVNLDCGTGTGIAGCGLPVDVVRGTNVQRLPSAPATWSADTVPKSFYSASIEQEPWVCRESLNGNRIAIGAWDDTTSSYPKLPAQIRYEGGTCTKPDGTPAPPAPPPPATPLPVPDLRP